MKNQAILFILSIDVSIMIVAAAWWRRHSFFFWYFFVSLRSPSCPFVDIFFPSCPFVADTHFSFGISSCPFESFVPLRGYPTFPTIG